jgi:hypothetical protein
MTAMLPLMNFLDGGKFVQSIKYGCEGPVASCVGIRWRVFGRH